MRTNLRTAELVVPWALLALACGGAASGRGGADEGSRIPTEAQFACDSLRERLVAIDVEAADEPTLVAAMEESESAVETCGAAWQEGLSDPVALLFAEHAAQELMLRSLLFEATLSRRFDALAGYCDILSDIFRLLLDGVADIEELLLTLPQDDPDFTAVISLRDLDLEALDVLYIEAERHCR